MWFPQLLYGIFWALEWEKPCDGWGRFSSVRKDDKSHSESLTDTLIKTWALNLWSLYLMGWLVIRVLSMFPWWACSWGHLAASISYHHLGFRSPLRVSVWVLCDSRGTPAKPPWVSLCCLSWNLLQALKGSAGGCWCCPWAVTESLTLTSCFQPLDSTSRHPTSKHPEVNLSHCFPSPSFLLHFSPSAQDPERRTGVPSSPPLTPVSSLQSLSVLLLTALHSTRRSGLPPSLLALSVHLDRPPPTPPQFSFIFLWNYRITSPCKHFGSFLSPPRSSSLWLVLLSTTSFPLAF